jgi:hypothetical protein
MNNAELNRTLKAAKAPEPSEEFRTQLPKRVSARLHWKTRPADARPVNWLPRFAWTMAGVTACLVAGFLVGHWRGHTEAIAENGFLQNEKVIKEMLAMFPNRVRAVVQDEHGLNVVLSDKDDVPASTPLWVKICDGKSCSAMVTFSGQQVRVNNNNWDVLADAQGRVIVTGNDTVWAAGSAQNSSGKYHIEAAELGS